MSRGPFLACQGQTVPIHTVGSSAGLAIRMRKILHEQTGFSSLNKAHEFFRTLLGLDRWLCGWGPNFDSDLHLCAELEAHFVVVLILQSVFDTDFLKPMISA